MIEPEDENARDVAEPAGRETPGGPYFGRLLIVLLIAVAFCGFMTWLLSTLVAN
jgi:hypothetical protein